VKEDNAIHFTDLFDEKSYDWIVHPFLFHIKEKNIIKLDWEHTEFRWIKPSEIKDYKTVPRFKDIVFRMFG
jgi:hypothetical protein